ncbi:AGR215Cp [Eremothecium gossypii ATCC 10895]|uniref:AGR215Cp n=1 Tax=Eremothecium gossypii (strain ATCC 10895 / CBS 109.51 / FGSC 9923 / NRRL Y-1056) TaxID=284811 RepID=Q74ZI7_EREGS|nr:AGR215Cp [Eremothecium gossypii ATCC 10895]AAS54705.1 AGR215Cp [Eremothecium gossypii ATCC 10895]AEY99035.1 FAGR215Cp [Eremothecium gossypii FDAG1]
MGSSRKYHAKFAQSRGQKPSLTFTTSPVVSQALYQFYPVLVIVDSVLNNMMWIQEDTCLGFVYLVLLYFSAQTLYAEVDRTRAFESWMSFVSAGFLGLSAVYYVHSTLKEMQESEAPTVDDIVIVLESVLDKLQRLRVEVLGSGLRRRLVVDVWAALKLVAVLTPLHWVLVRVLTPLECFTWFLVLASTYHSTWFQCTLLLCWRSLPVRVAYYRFWRLSLRGRRSGQPLRYRVLSEDEVVPFPRALQRLSGAQLQLKLQSLLISDAAATVDMESTDYIKVCIVEFCIDENERKWPKDGWSHTLLPYERQRYSLALDPQHRASPSPWRLQETVARDWHWVDDTWQHSPWSYCDTEWNFLGSKDSIGCYTRHRTWKRRAFRIKG